MFEDNSLLASLSPADRALLRALADEVIIETNTTVYEPGDAVTHCYFPRGTAALSWMVLLDDGDAVETVIIGREGYLGGLVGHGRLAAFARAAAVHGGGFYRIESGQLRELLARAPSIQAHFQRYADCLAAQLFQAVACNARHTIEQRTAKWLCAAVDRTRHSDIRMTQEQLAALMGSGRSYASRVVQRFKKAALLRTRRGGLEVLDYDGLRERACKCDDAVRGHFDAVLPGSRAN
jgi:CRP-like cAMP-binding protein